MKSATTVVVILSALSPAYAQGNFPYLATASVTGAARQAQLSSLASSAGSSFAAQPGYRSFTSECLGNFVTFPPAANSAALRYVCDPFSFASAAPDPSTTPVWLTQMPRDMQSYINNVDVVLQSIVQRVNSGAPAAVSATPTHAPSSSSSSSENGTDTNGTSSTGAQGTTGNGGGNGNGGSGLQTGGIVAIAVCGGVVAIAVIALIAFLVHRKQKRNRPAIVEQAYQPPPPQDPSQQQHFSGGVSQVGSNASSQPMTHSNMNAMLANQQPGEWDFAKQGVSQHQSAAVPENDGIKVTEISPDDAVDERHKQEMMSTVGSTNMAPTAIAPTTLSHHVQGV